MMPVIEEILAAKKREVERRVKEKPFEELVKAAKAKKPPSFAEALASKSDARIICEYKRASTAGALSQKPLPDAVRAFEAGGAAAVSVLTEESVFRGSLEDLRAAVGATRLPVLRKDFITTEYELLEAKANGASAALLIAGVSDLELVGACKKIGLDALVEAGDEKGIVDALDAGAGIIGINNRSFADLSVDLNRTVRLCGLVPENVLLVSESGFKNAADVKMLGKCERVPDAVLVGTAVMKAENVVEKATEFVEAGKGMKRRVGK